MPRKLNDPVLFFDGVCNLCNQTVDFLLRIDRRGVLKFATQQGKIGQHTLAELALNKQVGAAVVLLDHHGKLHVASGAVLRATRYLGGVWRLGMIFLLIPPLIRNTFYYWVAQNRYRWFGRRNTCRVPTAKEKERFLD